MDEQIEFYDVSPDGTHPTDLPDVAMAHLSKLPQAPSQG
jgi:hypothetical protein